MIRGFDEKKEGGNSQTRMEAGIPIENDCGKEGKEDKVAQKDVVIVSWDGPDDPENPRKSVLLRMRLR